MRTLTLWALAATLGLPVTSAAALTFLGDHVFGLSNLHARDSAQCGGDATLTPCGGSRPANWCCPSTTQCLTLNNTGTQAVICCPNGSSCATIQPITCDITFEDATKYPSSSVHIANLSMALPVCGSSCCPIGFECQTGLSGAAPFCRILAATLGSTTSVSPSGTTTLPNNATRTSTSTPTIPVFHSPGKKTNTGVIVGAVVGGIVVIAAIVFCCFFFRRKVKTRKQISEPIYNPQQAARSDFLNRYRARHPGPLSPRSPMSLRSPSKLFSPNRPETSDSRTPLTSTLASPSERGGVRTVYPPQRPPTAAQRAKSSGGSGLPSNMEQYSARILPSVPGGSASRSRQGTPTPGSSPKQGMTLPNSRFSPGKK
ncbi:hypothetical protein BT63DRAFT_425264 [Microthyrium microscopicum]|uniref:Mid2 domain-containing protein n=1 Tax=Microthyrium microscopicum TaxID=703497 RepID=A0A6A6UD58_9PEZI|nr:hypothetical protein BT63DRAFT_425264 [Microthyrium microscopicum]